MLRAATRRFARNPQLRRLMTAWGAFYTGDLTHYALIVVFAFSAGGATAVGLATVLNVLPGGLLGPLAAGLANSSRPQVHLAIGNAVRCVAMVATVAAVLVGAPVYVVLILVGLDSLLSAAVRPLHGALVVRLADTVAEAAAANSTTSSIHSASALAGPGLAGVTLWLVGIDWAFTVPAALFAVGTVAAWRITTPGAEATTTGEHTAGFFRTHLSEVGTGFVAIARSGPALAATCLFLVNMTLVGVWDVANALVAAERLGLGDGGITVIMAVSGVGGVLGALATLSIVGRRGLAVGVAITMVSWATVLTAIGMTTAPVPGLLLAACVGASAATGYAIIPTLVQRSVTVRTMAAASASLQSLYLLANAAGALIAPALFAWLGLPTALAVAGSAAVLVTLLAWPQLRHADALGAEAARNLAAIRATPLLAALPALALEQLSRNAITLSIPADSDVIHQGDRGDRFYMITAGLAAVTVDGHRVATLGPGGSFGEIALLDDAPRSATVTAVEDLSLVVVNRADFLGALSGDGTAVGRVTQVARGRLATRPVDERLADLDRDDALAGRSVADLLSPQEPLATITPAALDELAGAARVVAASDGALITRAGDYGDTFYVILDGAAQVLVDEVAVNHLGPGDGFGERAILRDVPRTATVRAVGETTLVAVDRASFERARRTRQ